MLVVSYTHSTMVQISGSRHLHAVQPHAPEDPRQVNHEVARAIIRTRATLGVRARHVPQAEGAAQPFVDHRRIALAVQLDHSCARRAKDQVGQADSKIKQ